MSICFSPAPLLPPIPPRSRFQVRPHPHQAGQHVLQLRQFHLHARLMRAGVAAEDLQDQLGAVHHHDLQRLLHLGALGGRQVVVEDHHVRAADEHFSPRLLELARADEGAGVDPRTRLHHFAHHLAAHAGRQVAQLLQGIGEGQLGLVRGLDGQQQRSRSGHTVGIQPGLTKGWDSHQCYTIQHKSGGGVGQGAPPGLPRVGMALSQPRHGERLRYLRAHAALVPPHGLARTLLARALKVSNRRAGNQSRHGQIPGPRSRLRAGRPSPSSLFRPNWIGAA